MILAILVAVALAAPPSDDALERVFAKMRVHKTVSAELVQVRHTRVFTKPQTARGHVLIGGPRLLRWEYREPWKTLLILNGDRVTMSYPDLGRTRRFDLSTDPGLKAAIETVLFFMRADTAEVLSRFEVTVTQLQQGVRLRLRPRAQAARDMVAVIIATIDTRRGIILTLELREASGDRTEIRFENTKTDVAVPPDAFEAPASR